MPPACLPGTPPAPSSYPEPTATPAADPTAPTARQNARACESTAVKGTPELNVTHHAREIQGLRHSWMVDADLGVVRAVKSPRAVSASRGWATVCGIKDMVPSTEVTGEVHVGFHEDIASRPRFQAEQTVADQRYRTQNSHPPAEFGHGWRGRLALALMTPLSCSRPPGKSTASSPQLASRSRAVVH
jgi:hypothetical protein